MVSISEFKKIIYTFYTNNKRSFAWRDIDDPYKIVISEVMLQQTQTHRVEQKFEEFTNLLPNFKSLAEAPFFVVLGLWKGLGYNRRAQWLQQSSQRVMNEFNGILPSDPLILETFKGIGYNTARSISTFAFNLPHVFIETNIRAVFIYHFFPQEEKVSDAQLLPLIEESLDKKDPRQWYYALMDYGVYLKKKYKNPARRSKHHARQSTFEGSDRQIRGRILEQLLRYKQLQHEEFYDLIMSDPVRIDMILEQLTTENLIKKVDSFYAL